MNTEESNYISLQEATKHCDYSQEYLSLRIRQGKLRGIKFGRNWVTKKEWLEEYLKRTENQTSDKSESYISLQEATKHCDYSQEYLSLRIRQGKLRGIKFGRNWVTKKEWMEEYLKDAKKSIIDQKSVLSQRPKRLSYFKKIISPQEISLSDRESLQEPPAQRVSPAFRISFAYIAAIIFLLFFLGTIFVVPSFQKITDNFQTATISFQNSQGFAGYVSGFFKKIGQEMGQIGQWVGEGIKNQISNWKRYYFAFSDFINKKPPTETKKEGLVVVPSTAEDEALRQKIKDSFSDEIKIEMKDKTWGIIKPVFKTPSEQEYLYMMVPVKN